LVRWHVRVTSGNLTHFAALACALQAAQQLSGFNCAMYYAATILHMAGFRSNSSSTYFSIVVSATNCVFTGVALSIIDKVGRRRILIYSMIAMIIGLFALGGAFAGQQGFMTQQADCVDYATNCARCLQDDRCAWSSSQSICAATTALAPSDIYQSSTGCPPQANQNALTGILFTALVVYVAGYALGLGNVPWLMQSELFPLSIRGKANGIATAVNWSCNLVISTSFLSMTNGVSAAGTFWFYAGLSIVLWIFVLFEVPEVSYLDSYDSVT
jgi:SP family myo-inositol transporter-like MFS transporter 13